MYQPIEEPIELEAESRAGDIAAPRSERQRARPQQAPRRPPLTNRGVYHGREADQSSVFVVKNPHHFDYYRATPRAEYSELKTVLKYELAEMFGPIQILQGAAGRHYQSNDAFLDEMDNVVCELLSGGPNVRPNVLARGASSDAVAAILRANWDHGPSRVDPCIDVAQNGLFAALRVFAEPFAAKWRIHHRTILNSSDDEGDTIYLGSRTSQVFVRIYQPGLKRAQEECRTGNEITQDERDTVRIEMEFKPQNRKAKK
ncbi:replication initiation factor domain-containing protein, partial [Psychroserpens sp.]|uniref:replication initiation factor domain-containing protein n=1 Tax=Psychroserpens sp. TaxID=2020870 RepID=UPI003C73EF8A